MNQHDADEWMASPTPAKVFKDHDLVILFFIITYDSKRSSGGETAKKQDVFSGTEAARNESARC